MENYHIIEVKYFGPTASGRGSRVRLRSARFGQSVTLSYDHGYRDSTEQAESWLAMNGHKVIGQGEVTGGAAIICEAYNNQFKPLKETKHAI